MARQVLLQICFGFAFAMAAAAGGGGASPAYGPQGNVLAPLPGTERGRRCFASLSPDRQNIVYCNGSNVIIRSIDEPEKCVVYDGHRVKVLCARFSPNGNWVASGDEHGHVRVWAWKRKDRKLKVDTVFQAGKCMDVAWGPESKRIAAVGDGNAKAKVFQFDTGSSLSPEVKPAGKTVNSCAMRPKRPFRLAYGGEDFNIQFYKGPPFKHERDVAEHTNFVNCVCYAPDGDSFVSVSSDKKIFVYDGETGEKRSNMKVLKKGHKGSVYTVDFSPDGARLVTASADKTLKLWDIADRVCTKTITLGGALGDMQNAALWAREDLLASISLSGAINLIPAGGDAPADVLAGHTARTRALDADAASGLVATGDDDGRVCVWTPVGGDAARMRARIVGGEAHPKAAVAVAVAGGQLASVGYDNQLRICTDAASATPEYSGSVALGGAPRALAAASEAPDVRAVVTVEKLLIFNGAEKVAEADLPQEDQLAEGKCVDISADGSLVAVGKRNGISHIYDLDAGAGSLTLRGTPAVKLQGAVASIAIHPDKSKVAMGDNVKEVVLVGTTGDFAPIVKSLWTFHTSVVSGLSWSPDGTTLVSVGNDQRLCAWREGEAKPVAQWPLAHQHPLAAVRYIDGGSVWALGTDGVARRFEAVADGPPAEED